MDLENINPRLAAEAMKQPHARQTSDAISNLESEIGLALPKEYTEFLTKYGATEIQNTDLGWFIVTFLAGDSKKRTHGYLGGFFGAIDSLDFYKNLTDPTRHHSNVESMIPKTMIPIGVDFSTNYVLLDLSTERSGWVWQWPEQYATWGTEENNQMGLIARSFTEFLAGIRTEDEAEAELRR